MFEVGLWKNSVKSNFRGRPLLRAVNGANTLSRKWFSAVMIAAMTGWLRLIPVLVGKPQLTAQFPLGEEHKKMSFYCPTVLGDY